MKSDLDVMLEGIRGGRRVDSKWARMMIYQHTGLEREIVAKKIAKAVVDGFEAGRMSTENLDGLGMEYHFQCGSLHHLIQLAILKKIAHPSGARGKLIFSEIISSENQQDETNNEFIDAAISHCLDFDLPHRKELAEDICQGVVYKSMCRGEEVPEKVFKLINTEDIEDVAEFVLLVGSSYTKHKYQAGAQVPRQEPKVEYDQVVDWIDSIASMPPQPKPQVLDRALTLVLQDRKWSSPMNVHLLLSAGASWANVQKQNIHPVRQDLSEMIEKHPAVRRSLLMEIAQSSFTSDEIRGCDSKRPGI